MYETFHIDKYQSITEIFFSLIFDLQITSFNKEMKWILSTIVIFPVRL
jgi:hypothetical protein